MGGCLETVGMGWRDDKGTQENLQRRWMCSLAVGMVSHVYTYTCYIHIHIKTHQIVHIKYVQFIHVNYTLIKLFLKRNKQVSLLGPSLQPSGQSPHSAWSPKPSFLQPGCSLQSLSVFLYCMATSQLWLPEGARPPTALCALSPPAAGSSAASSTQRTPPVSSPAQLCPLWGSGSR